MSASPVSLDDKYQLASGRVYLTGTQALVRLAMVQRKRLRENHVFFTPGVNEEIAATAVWGSQQVQLFEGAKYDGVYAMWYGKGPGVDRTGDVFKHANAAGTSKHGG